MVRRYFGTDGIRGRANGVITPDLALRVGQAAGLIFRRGEHRHRVLIGKDTRLSGYMIETALVAGFTSVGMDVLLTGPMPTPAVAMLTRSMRADIGVMISASHNPYYDNGIKLFGPDGYKLSDEIEERIEGMLDKDIELALADSDGLGRAKRVDGVHDRYIEFAKRTLPRSMSLSGLRIVVDCANGASYKVASEALWELGAERFLGDMKLQLHRTKVGDRYVVEHMRAHGLNVGGEQSGHIVLSDFSTTGDGLVSALQVLACIKRQNRPVSELSKKFEPVPQLLKNVRISGGKPLEEAPVKAAIED